MFGLKHKIWTTIMVVALCTIVIGTGLTYFLYEQFYVEKQRATLVMQGEELENFYHTSQAKQEFLQRVAWTDQTSDANVLYTEDPMMLSAGIPAEGFSDTSLITFEERQQLLEGDQITFIRQHPRFDQDILAVTIPLLQEDQLEGAIFLYMPLTAMEEPFQSIRLVLFIFLIVLLIVITWIGLKMTDHLIKPLKEMETISYQMAQGDFSKRIIVSKQDEIGNLSNSFNTLAASLEEVDQKRREFLQNVSHELRTPLSYIKGYTEVLQEDFVDEKSRENYLSIINNEVARLIRLVNDLLDLAQLEDDSYPMKDEPLPYAQLILDVVERFELFAKQKQVTIEVEVDHDIVVSGDADRLEQVVSNLLDNAIRYTPNGEKILVGLAQEDNQAQLLIQDDGPGIPKEDLPKVVERFYRVNSARTRKEGGTGIGLSIVYQIIKKHKGDLTIESEEGKGTTVKITIPQFS
ncbi:ATP-binding protein [Aquibacillus koreensis]|uniref:histidine kinase n=1 Tax=Aquibacillus koreensis TaxID=279446 RepID=A0A9X3WI68_9BACI|nr:HAMP domain-containing sensor histidine kinase [Aquibacillus koreensis]MCT2536499.1 ATP-binding protein [Aquibacillus koreensis]MDC3419413.1 ATP-binding protein [Aquibacillus koreensis]